MKTVEITTSQIKEVLKRNIKAGSTKVPLFLGPFGLGKSHVANELSEELDLHYIDYRCAYKSFNDVRGYGVPNYETRTMEFLRDEDFDFHPTKQNLLNFDEVLQGNSNVQKVLFQAMHDRRIGKMIFPKDTIVMACSNRLSDKAGVERLNAALADRFAIYWVRPDLRSFTDHLAASGADLVLAYIQTNPTALYDFDLKDWEGESSFPSNRSFAQLQKLTDSYASLDDMANDLLFVNHCQAYVGAKHGQMFSQFINIVREIGSVEALLEEADTCEIPKSAEMKWVVACKLISLANRKNLDKVLTLSHRLVDSTGQPWELLKSPNAMQQFVMDGVSRDRLDLCRHPQLNDWKRKFANTQTA